MRHFTALDIPGCWLNGETELTIVLRPENIFMCPPCFSNSHKHLIVLNPDYTSIYTIIVSGTKCTEIMHSFL